MIIDCKVLCYRKGNENLKEDDIDLWLPMSVDLDLIFAVKQNGGEDKETNTLAVIWHVGGDYFVIDWEFERFNKLWKRHKSGTVGYISPTITANA